MIPVFNFLRAFACFLVVLTHIFAYAKYVPKVWGIASFAMAVFFFITGFLIPLSLDKLENSKKFLIRRAFRLFPVLLFSICFAIVLHYVFGCSYKYNVYKTTSELIRSVFITLFSIDFFHNKIFDFSTAIIIGPAWSLSVEWKFYLVTAVSYYLFKDSRSRLYCMIAFVGMLACSALYSNSSNLNIRANILLIYVCLVGSATYFYYSKSLSKKEFLLLWVALLIVVFQVRRFGIDSIKGSQSSIAYTLGALLTTIIVLKFPNFGNNKVCNFFADTSYSMYLLHIIFINFIMFDLNHGYIMKNFSSSQKVIFGIGIYLAIIPFCYLIYRFIEKPFIKIGYRLTDGVKK